MAGPADDGSISRVYSIAKIASLLVEMGLAPSSAVATEDVPATETAGSAKGTDAGGILVGVPPEKSGAGPMDKARVIKPGSAIIGMAVRRAEPVYPPAASSAGLAGSVLVEVIIDEHGYVITASAVSGDPLLKGSAVAAARGWLFKRTELDAAPVKVLGTLTFNFTLAPK